MKRDSQAGFEQFRISAIAQAAGLPFGPVVAIALYVLLPGELAHAPRAVAAVAGLMAVWWLTEAIPLSATALLPIVLFPLLDVMPIGSATAPYADKVIFLFLGGFLLGLAMQRWNLHKRIALIVILIVGAGPTRLIAGFMIATAVMSAWVSNTATAAMMVPIGLSLITLLRSDSSMNQRDVSAFAGAIMLGITYAASIGGVATLIGTPPNGVLKSFVEANFDHTITFQRWMLLGVPVAGAMLPLTWVYLTRVAFPIRFREIPGGRGVIRQKLKDLGPISLGECSVLVIFACTALAWILRPQIATVVGMLRGSPDQPLALTDEGIAVIAGVMLFLVPVNWKRREFVLDWKTAEGVPFGILLLFGGGLSLAAGIKATGLDAFLGMQFDVLAGAPVWLVTLAVSLVVIFATELTSNTALTAALLPVLAGAAPAIGVSPETLLVPATLCASFAFMLPVATPPNAIVFASGEIPLHRMARAGLALNILGAILVTLASVTLAPMVVEITSAPPTIFAPNAGMP